MSCKKVAEVIHDYLDGHLPDAKRCEVESHLEECSHCSAEAENLGSMLECLRSLRDHESPVECWAVVRQRIVRAEERSLAWWKCLMRPIFAAPAVAVVALLTLILVWPSGDGTRSGDLVSAQEYRHYVGAHSTVQGRQAFADPNVIFVSAELEKASVSGY